MTATPNPPEAYRKPDEHAVVLILREADVKLAASALRLLASCARSDAADVEHIAARGHHDEAHRQACADEAATLRGEAEHADELRSLCEGVLS